MGRWAQQRRRGGTRPGVPSTDLAVITNVGAQGVQTIRVNFDRPVTAAAFTPSGMDILGDGGTSVMQAFPNSLDWQGDDWPNDTQGETWHLNVGPADVWLPQTGVVT